MPQLDQTSEFDVGLGLNAQVISTNTTTNGNIIDAKDYFGGLDWILFSGAYTDGAYTVLVEGGNESDLSDAVAIPDNQLLAQNPKDRLTAPEAQISLDGANQVAKIGVLGGYRYYRLSVVSTGVTTGATLGSVFKGKPDYRPAIIE